MSTKKIIFLLASFVVALIALILVLSTGSENASLKVHTPVIAESTLPKKNDLDWEAKSSAREVEAGPAKAPQATPTSETSAEADPESRQALMDKIQEAVGTYSDDGVAMVEPLLASPDLEIRESAIEAMKQIATPGAAESLRRAAQKSTTSPLVKKLLLDAASFIDLPPHQFKPQSNQQ